MANNNMKKKITLNAMFVLGMLFGPVALFA